MKPPSLEGLTSISQRIQELNSVYRDAISRCNISENEFWVWYSLIVMGDDWTQQAICRTWSLPKQTVNSIIQNMVRKEYITLQAVPGSRKTKKIILTREGTAYGNAIVRPVYEKEQQVFGRLPWEDQQAFLKFLDVFTKGLRSEIAGTV